MRSGMPGSEFITISADAPSAFARVALSSKEQPPRKTTRHRPAFLPISAFGSSWLCAGGKGQPSRVEGNTTSRSRSDPLAEKEAAPAGEEERCHVRVKPEEANARSAYAERRLRDSESCARNRTLQAHANGRMRGNGPGMHPITCTQANHVSRQSNGVACREDVCARGTPRCFPRACARTHMMMSTASCSEGAAGRQSRALDCMRMPQAALRPLAL